MAELHQAWSGALDIPGTLPTSLPAPLTRLVGVAHLGPTQVMGLLGSVKAVVFSLGLTQALDVEPSRLLALLDA